MQAAHNLVALEAQFNSQNSELMRIQELLGSLDTGQGLNIDPQALEAIDAALELAPQAKQPALLPALGTRA